MPATVTDKFSAAPVFTVSALARRARLHIEEEFSFVQVEGELSNFRRPGSGHWYFTLKDEHAQLRCAMFAGNNRRVTLTPSDGAQVIIRGRVSLYEARGDFQIIAEQMSAAGEGALRAAFEALQRKLESEGLFDPARKRALPPLPRHLTIISSASGAALRDVLHVIARRYPTLAITLIPSLVQGAGAESELLRALEQAANSNTDLVLLTRGGGSLEDLWAFNLESVARAVAASPHPVVSAIGHQTDFTITDFVADVRAPTPSAGAELLTPAADELQALLANQTRRLNRAMQHSQRLLQQQLQLLRARLTDPRAQLSQQMQLADDLEARLVRAFNNLLHIRSQQLRGAIGALTLVQPARILPARYQQLSQNRQRLDKAMFARLATQQLSLAGKVRALEAVSPLQTLSRGYAVLSQGGATPRPVTSVSDTQPGSRLKAFLQDGALEVEVTDVLPGESLTAEP
jgi:exodeoxyribonuclease VII large subunit